jgi:hypothetical protein
VALGARCALALGAILAEGVPLGVENSLAASRATEVYLRSHAWDGGYAYRAARNATIGAFIATVRRTSACQRLSGWQLARALLRLWV